MIHRFMYLNVPEIASLYAQIHGEDIVETLITTEHSRLEGLKLAINAFLGGTLESGAARKESITKKVTKRPENLIREVVASLRARGTLHRTVQSSLGHAKTSFEPAWFEARHPFSMPFALHECNDSNRVVFLSGEAPEHIEMSASLHHFPGARDGRLGVSSHEALLFNSMRGRERPFYVFGSLFPAGDRFQIKPVAIAV